MKLRVRILAVILILLLLPFQQIAVCRADASPAPEDTDDFKKLLAFGIMEEDDEILYEGFITRASFIKYAMRCVWQLYPLLSPEKNENIFNDVNENTNGYEEIYSALQSGILSKGEMFYPDNEISINEASKILVNALGYGELAQRSGGYPNGFLKIAQRLKLFKNCNFESDGTMGTESFFKLLMNFLESEFITADSVEKESAVYGSANGELLLSKAMDIYKITGVITANAYASIFADCEAPKGCVTIGNETYETGTTDAAFLLGYNAEIYYKKYSSDKKEILYIKEKNNSVRTLKSRDILPESVSNDGFRYYDKEKTYSGTVSGLVSATYILNGARTLNNPALFLQEHADIKLVDYDNDGKYDVVIIMDYRNAVAASVSKNTFKISDELGGDSIELDPSASEYDFVIEKNGEKIDFTQIKVNDIISYAANPSEKLYIKYLIVSSSIEEGTVQAISDEEITVNSKTFTQANSIKGTVKAGDYGRFYIDYDGCVIWKDTEKDIVYGYLTKCGKSGLNTVSVRIFTENNRWVSLNLQKKIKFCSGDTDYGQIKATDYKDLHFLQGFIRYNVNENGEVVQIQYAKVLPDLKNPEFFDENYAIAKRSIENNTFVQTAYFAKAKYRSVVKSFDNAIGVSDATKIFVLPEDKSIEEKFAVVKPSDLFGDAEYKNVYSYDANDGMQAKAVVLDGNAINVVSGESKLIVVEKLLGSITADGTDTYTIKGTYMGSKDALFQLKDKNVLQGKSITPGDVVQVSFNNDGLIANLNEVYDISAGKTQYFCSTSDEYTTSTKMAGMVKNIDRKNYTILLDNGSSVGTYSTAKLANVYIYDTADKNVSLGSAEDIENGTYIFAYIKQFSIQEAVVIKQ